ncbi:MAG: SapC family protein [Pseudomonadota bacterium]|nr:SapC family protein [Pseudomonadota bacterium]
MSIGSQPLFFESAVPLDARRHANWRLKQADGFEFAAKANALPVTLPELPKVCVEYPVVFLDEGQGPFPVAVVGLRPQRNLFVTPGGRWDARYVPAYARMYPFILAGASAGSETYTVCLDAGYTGFNEQDGEPLFTESGAQSQFLQRAVAFLREFQLQRTRTVDAARVLSDAGLLAPMHAKIQLRSGEALSLAGFQTLDEQKFSALTDAGKGELISSGALEMIHLHRASLHLFDRLVGRLARREAAGRKNSPVVGARKTKGRKTTV